MTEEKTDLRDRITLILDEKDMKVADLARKLTRISGIKIIAQIVYNWMNRGSIPPNRIEYVAEVLEVSEDWLKGLTDERMPAMDGIKLKKNQVAVPIILGFYKNGEDEEMPVRDDVLVVSDDWFRQTTGLAPSNNLGFVAIEGDSMEPTLKAGDIVLINRARKERSDGLFSVSLEGQKQIKRLAFMPSGKVLIISDNERYPDKECNIKQLNILGRVSLAYISKRF